MNKNHIKSDTNCEECGANNFLIKPTPHNKFENGSGNLSDPNCMGLVHWNFDANAMIAVAQECDVCN